MDLPLPAAAKPAKNDKTMSSNLLTMKFMRRAAASKEAQGSPEVEKPRNTKRARLSTDAEIARPSDMEAITAALAAEEEKRQQAVSRAAEEAGETHWVLNVPTTAQYAPQPLVMAADSLDADDYSGGRQAFGNFKRKEKNPPPPPSKEEKNEFDEQNEDADEDDYDEDEEDTPGRQSSHKMNALKNQKYGQAGKARSKQDTDKLSGLTSISSNGGNRNKMGAPSSDKKKKKRKSR